MNPVVALIATVILATLVAAICYFDFRWFIIPDWLNALLFVAGVAVRAIAGWQDGFLAVLVAACTTLAIWLIREIHRRATKRVGLGLGDVKLAGASAVWISAWNLPLFMFLASLFALLYFAARFGFRRHDIRKLRVPFGPFLGLALIATWGLERSSLFNLAPQ